MDAPQDRLRIGLFLPTWTTGSTLPRWTMPGGDGIARWADILATARQAEEVGFDSLWVCDHMLMDDDWERPADGQLKPGDGATGCWDPWAVLAGVAAATSRIGLGTMVACTAYQVPARLAKLADTIQEISDGRLIVGLGAGDHWSEFLRFGIPTERPIGRFEEALSIIAPLLREGHVDVEGVHYSARDCRLWPRPRLGGSPILIGTLGDGPRMLRLVATYADIWNGWHPFDDDLPFDSLRAQRDLVDAACIAVGRDPATLLRTAGVSVAFADSEGSGGSLRGTDEQIAEQLLALGNTGVSHVQILTSPSGIEGLDRMARVIELVSQAG
jgi:alkanesulfonate monooxygenase SsuD/methylene tetrahydromethanopterin reductase-like flavin-dependent oxidoreductase (luciferase family)